MNKSVSLLMTVLLITQIASLSFNDAPSSVDSEDSFTSDEQWLVSGRDNGTVNNTSNECLMFNNVSYDYNYSSAPQDSFNITADLFNYCSEKIMYPSTLILNEIQGINVSSDSVNWRYAIYGNYSYPVSWLVTRDSTVVEGTFVTFEIHPTIDNCSENCSESQNNSYNLSIPFGLIDVNSCYILDNVSDDYIPSEMSFNLSASLNNTCGGDIHYPSGVLYDGDGTVSSPAEGVQNIGAMAYMIYGNTSTTVNWQISIDQNISNGTLVNFSLQPVCSMYNIQISAGSFPSYMQDCSYSTFDQVLYTVMVGVPLNQTEDPANYSDGNDTGGNNTGGNATGDDSCEVWEYWNPDLIDTTLPGNGCPHYIDESNTEDEDTGGNATGGNATGDDSCEVWEYWNPDLIDTTLPGNGCPHYIDESSTEGDESGLLPSIGVVGTLAAIGVGFIVVTRREQEE